MVVLPLLAALVSLIFTVAIVRDAWRAPRPDKVSWAIAFAIFAGAAGAEVVGDLAGWSVPLARLYYLTGAVLVTLFLGLGQLYLLFGRRIARFAPGVTLAVVAIAVSLVLDAPVDTARLPVEHWRAIDRGPLLLGVVAASNAFGVVALLGGSLYSAWQFWRTRTRPHRMVGCLLIAAGTLVIASKGYLERLGVPVSDSGFYLLLTVGSVIIFAGYLETRRPEPVSAGVATPAPALESSVMETTRRSPATIAHPEPVAAPPVTARVGTLPPAGTAGSADPGIVFIETRFLPLDDEELGRLAATWSAPRIAGDALSTEQARRVWALRCRLSADGQAALDRHTLPAALQLAELYESVFAVSQPVTPVVPLAEPLTLLGGQR